MLLNYSKPDSLRNAIDSIRQQEKRIEIIIVDNSPDGSAHSLLCDRYISAPSNLHCKVRFLLAAYASADVIFTLDDDVLLNGKHSLEPYVELLQGNAHIRDKAVLGFEHYTRRSEPESGWVSVDFVKGRFMVFHRDYLQAVSIGYHDNISPDAKLSSTGYGTPFVAEDWIGIDDLAFQMAASHVLIPYSLASPIRDQPTAKEGLWRKPGHMDARRHFRNSAAWKITRLPLCNQ